MKLASFPKSGRTWLRYACHVAGVPEPEFTHAGHATTPPENLGLRFKGVPNEMKLEPVIFLHRNPIDTAVSYYFQIWHKDLIHGRKNWDRMRKEFPDRLPSRDISNFVRSKTYGVPLICTYNRAWLNWQSLNHDPVFTYEEFHEDAEAAFTRFFEVLGHPGVDVAKVVQETTFKRMKALQDSGDGDPWRLVQPFRNDPLGAKVRQGQVRGYKQHLDRDTVLECRKIARRFDFNA